jgi:cell wall assembly regulator SMI1
MTSSQRCRLLELFPVGSLRKQWPRKKGKKPDVIDGIVKTVPPADVQRFAWDKFGLLRQHIRLLTTSGAPSKPPLSVLSIAQPIFTRGKPTTEWFYLIPLEIKFVYGSPPTEARIDLPWPVRLRFESGTFVAQFTTIEKDLSAHVPSGEPVFGVRRSIEVSDVLDDASSTLGTLVELDVNKGVKHLWNIDSIDACRAGWEETVASNVKNMHVSHLLKRDDPKAFAVAIKAPLMKSVFERLASIDWPEILTVDCQYGEIAITRYSDSETAVDNVVREILKHN